MDGFSYLSLITDAYSRKIVSHALHPKRRKKEFNFILIYHSDRPCNIVLVDIDILQSENIAISMTQTESPYENTLAERMNEIIKNEFFQKRIHQNHKEAQKAIDRIVHIYNNNNNPLCILNNKAV